MKEIRKNQKMLKMLIFSDSEVGLGFRLLPLPTAPVTCRALFLHISDAQRKLISISLLILHWLKNTTKVYSFQYFQVPHFSSY